MTDTTAPILTELSFPSVFDILNADVPATFTASASDRESGVDEVVIWFDRSFTDNIGTFPLVGLFGYSDSWVDGHSSETRKISHWNAPGTYSVTKVDVRDLTGNTRSYSSSELKSLGFSSRFEIYTEGYHPSEDADVLQGSAKVDALHGYEGNDTVHGLVGNDVLFGGDGDDSLDGGADNDELWGGTGNDRLDGSEGIDTAAFLGKRSDYTVSRDLNGTIIVADIYSGRDGMDSIVGVEKVKFSDGTHDVATLLNKAPTSISLSDSYVTENNWFSAQVGLLLALDPDAGDVVRFELISDSDGRFLLWGNSLKVAPGVVFDYEKVAAYTVKVRAIDQRGLSFEQTFTINVRDVLEITSGTARPETLTGGQGADRIVGAGGNDQLNGGAGDDVLIGGAGNDTLTGDAGSDIFIFDAKLGTWKTDRKINFDTITDFEAHTDRIYLDNAIFQKLGKGTETQPVTLNKASFVIGAKAKDKNDYILYNLKTGVLSYDADGSGKGQAIEFAQVKKGLVLQYGDLYII